MKKMRDLTPREKRILKAEVAAMTEPFVTHVIEKNGNEWSYSRDIKDPEVQAYLLGTDNRLPGKRPRKKK